jgi:hypothetical protein
MSIFKSYKNSSTESNIVLTSTLGRKKNTGKTSGRKQACCSTMHPGVRLIKKVFNIDPMICPSCNGNMKIISFIEDQSISFIEWVMLP